MKRLAVLASGEGTNLEAIFEAIEREEVAAEVGLVISDRPTAPALGRARRREVKARFLDPRPFATREEYDCALLEILQQESVDLVVLAGFMRLLSPVLVKEFYLRIMNIHPSLLPAFPGLNAVEQALDHGVKVTGCTVHFVDEGLDTGPIILQQAVPILEIDTIETLHQRIHAVEHRLYPRAIDLFSRDKLTVKGRRCYLGER
ncbi:MAG: phosphoribosylglycinamide formyltransferase [Firmicutes bacterium]|nr:phosphoribosylglycinamide formyltransferase [Bacillota bacterium]